MFQIDLLERFSQQALIYSWWNVFYYTLYKNRWGTTIYPAFLLTTFIYQYFCFPINVKIFLCNLWFGKLLSNEWIARAHKVQITWLIYSICCLHLNDWNTFAQLYGQSNLLLVKMTDKKVEIAKTVHVTYVIAQLVNYDKLCVYVSGCNIFLRSCFCMENPQL